MNCKAGDLAIVTRIPEEWLVWASPSTIEAVRRLLGTIVRCVRPGQPNISGYPTWVLEQPLSIGSYPLIEIEDVVLTPIRGGNVGVEESKELEAV